MNPLIVSAGSLVPKLQTVRFIVTLVATEALFQATWVRFLVIPPSSLPRKHFQPKKNILWFQLHPKDVVPQRDREGLVMEATELDFVLMSNPVVSMNLEEAIRFIRFLKT